MCHVDLICADTPVEVVTFVQLDKSYQSFMACLLTGNASFCHAKVGSLAMLSAEERLIDELHCGRYLPGSHQHCTQATLLAC